MCKMNKWGNTRIDPCMREVIKWLGEKHKIIMCCCGHNKYPMSIIVKEAVTAGTKRFIVFREIFSGINLRILDDVLEKYPKRFYKRDKYGYYYIPEIIELEGRI